MRRGRRPRDEFSGVVSREMPKEARCSFSLVGDAAIISIPRTSDLEGRKKEIGEAIIARHRNVKTVLNKVTRLEGERRVAELEVLAGEGTVTCHREYGFAYHLDLAKVFFNPRLGSERMRVASKARAGERIIVPFAGVGPFAIPLAAAGARVLALEISSEACRWLAENARLNRVDGNIEIVNCDAFEICRILAGRSKDGEEGKSKRPEQKFDRAVVPTPYGRDEILEVVGPLVRPGGAIHFYTFKRHSQIEGLIQEFEEKGLAVEFHRRCGNVAPSVSRWAFDLRKL